MPERSEPDALQIKAIATQLFDVWEAKRGEAEKKTLFGASIPAWVACALSILGVVLLMGGTNEKVNSAVRRLDTIEAVGRDDTKWKDDVTKRLGRIEGKLEATP